jgi:UDP-N-acetylmuramoyl-L-alanyl-D-glutamate--2,6-diaminopimelate ligase
MSGLGIAAVHGDASGVRVTGVSLDSRSVRAGDLFAALPGHREHGSAFAAAAVASGAAAVLTDPDGAAACLVAGVPVVVAESPRAILGEVCARIYGHPARSLRIAGVTGTNGKTTVSYMVDAGFGAAGLASGLIGTTGVRIDGESAAIARTTPEAPELQQILAAMVDRGVRVVSMEVSSIALAEHRVDGIVFEVAAFTNLSQDHLDYHRDMEDYFAAKSDLFTSTRARLGIVGIDDDWGRRLARSSDVPVQTWSLLDPQADWFGFADGDSWRVRGPDGSEQELVVALPGRFNVANAVCAFAILRSMGIDGAAAARGLSMVHVPGRLERVQSGSKRQEPIGLVDYAHSPDAIERVVDAARSMLRGGRVLVVLGAGGDRDRGKRPAMGRAAAAADLLVVTDDNPRTEDPAAIREAVASGAHVGASVVVIADRAEAIRHAVGAAGVGDAVLVLGKGHEQGQERMGQVSPFDDRVELAAALADWRPAR